ncbi:MAG: hypothetical protein IIT64_11345, partial [Bacteroidaceae bacterium]|nr:hypothetical protein [Bacteroidaceae bacterium]
MAIIDEILKRAQANKEQQAARTHNSLLDGYEAHKQEAWRDWKGAVNTTDLATGQTTRRYFGPASEKRVGKDNLSSDLRQAIAGAMQRQEASYKGATANVLLGAADLLNGKKEYHPKVGSWLWRLSEGAEADMGAANRFMEDSKAGHGKAYGLVMDLTSGAVDLASDALLTAATGGASIGGKLGITAGLGAMGARSFGSGAMEAEEKGLSRGQQFLSGLKSATIEMLTEKIGGPFEKAYGASALGRTTKSLAERLSKNAGMEFALKALGNFASEGGEEVLSDVLNPLADKLLKLDNGEGWQNLWTADGFSQMAYDGLVGGLLGFFGGAVEGLSPEERAKAASDGIDNAIAANQQGKSIANELEADTDGVVAQAISNTASQTPPEGQQQSPSARTPSTPQTAVKQETGELNTEPEAEQPKQKSKRKSAQDLAWETFYGDETRAREAREDDGIAIPAWEFDDTDESGPKAKTESQRKVELIENTIRQYREELKTVTDPGERAAIERLIEDNTELLNTLRSRETTEQAQELIKADERTRETGELDYDPSKVPEEILKEKERLEREAKESRPEPTYEAPKVNKAIDKDSPEAANDESQARREWDEDDWAKEEARLKKYPALKEEEYEPPKPSQPQTAKKSRAKKAETGTDILVEAANNAPNETGKASSPKTETAAEVSAIGENENDHDPANAPDEVRRIWKEHLEASRAMYDEYNDHADSEEGNTPEYIEDWVNRHKELVKKAKLKLKKFGYTINDGMLSKDNKPSKEAKKASAKKQEVKSGADVLAEQAKAKKPSKSQAEKKDKNSAEAKTEEKPKTKPKVEPKAESEVEEKKEASPEKPKKKLNEENLKKNPSELIKEKVESFLGKMFGKEYDIRGKFRITDSAIEYKDRDGGGILIEGPEQESVKGKLALIESAATQKQTGVKHDKPTDVTITLQNGKPLTKGAVPSKATDYLSSDEFKSKAKNAFGDSKVILSGQVVNAYDESTKRTVREGEDEAWMRSVNSSLFTKKGTKLGQKLVVTGVSVDGKALTGADFYDAVEKLGLEGKARIDVKAPSYNADYAQEFDRRRKHIGDRNIPVRDRLQFAKDMERVDLLNAVDRFVERFREEQIADNEDGVLSSEAVEEFFDEQLEKFVKDYEDAHNYRWDIIDGEVVRIDNDTSRVDSASDVLEAMYDAYRLKKQGEAARRERLKRSLTNVLGVGEIAKAIKDNINRNVKSMTTAIDTGTFNLKVEGVDSPYGMTVTYVYDGDYKTLNQKKEAKDNGRGYYVVELFHPKGKAKNGNDIRIFRFNAGDIDTASSRSAMIIKEYERGITAAKESVMKMTRKSIRQKLTNQLTKKMTNEGKLAFLTTNPDYKGEYKVGDFTAKVSEEYTPWHGEKVLDRYDMRLYYKGQEIGQYTYAVKKGKKPNLIQRISTAIHNANYNIGDNHFFDLLEAEQNYLVRQNKGKTTVIGPNGEISESMSDSPIDAINEATGQKGKADKASEGTLERRRIRDEVITPSEENPYRVKVDGKTYEVVYQFRKADDKYANGSTALQYRIYETGNEDITALVDVNKNNADITAKEAVEFVLKHPKMWGNHESAVESEVDAAIERSANESKAKEKQSGTPAEAGERNTNAESDRREGSDNRRPDGRRTVRSLRDVERKETRVAQSLEEREAESVVNNITRGRAKVRIVSFGDALSRELGLTRSTQNQYHSYEEKGTHVSGKVSGEVILPEHIPDGTIARRGIGGHEGTHAEFINKFGEEAKAKAVLFWNTFKNLHPNEAS